MFEAGAIYIVGVTGVIGMILFMRKLKFLLRFLTRGCLGIVLIYGINTLLESVHLSSQVGINPLTAGCVTLLGVPGVVLLYALAFLL